ncbi:MAG: murein biosynthesis integral membrane protein MurJ [Spirochaetales bacterium]
MGRTSSGQQKGPDTSWARPTSRLSGTARSTAGVMALTTLSRLLGFVRQAVLNAVFGATGSADVLNAVFNIPNNLRKLLAEGALSSAFIPVLSQAIVERDDGKNTAPEGIVRRLLGFQYLILVPLLLASVVFARPIVEFVLDFPDAERQLLAVGLFRWFIHYTLLISLSAVIMGSLNSSNRFAVPAFTPILFSVSVILSLVFLSGQLGVYAMAVGVLGGGVAQILFQLPQFRSKGFSFLPMFSFNDHAFKLILGRWIPVVAASSIFAINQLVAFRFASGLENGSASALANAVIFWQLPQGIFAVSVTTVLFPKMSRQAGQNDHVGLRASASSGLRSIAALLIPSSVLLAVFGPEVIAMAFQRGEFTASDTARTAEVLVFYCVGMVGVSCYTFLQRFFYAIGDYRSPIYTATGILVANIALSLWLKETALGPAGLALANSIGFTVGSLVLTFIARSRLNGVNGRDIVSTVLKAIVAAIAGGSVIVGSKAIFGPWWLAGSSVRGVMLLLLVGTLALAGTVVAMMLLRVEAARSIARRFIHDNQNSED